MQGGRGLLDVEDVCKVPLDGRSRIKQSLSGLFESVRQAHRKANNRRQLLTRGSGFC